ncbi:MAG: hypothetical protein ACI9XO_003508 [Paraglaciecola sp.]|jgi:hypothetical protein
MSVRFIGTKVRNEKLKILRKEPEKILRATCGSAGGVLEDKK